MSDIFSVQGAKILDKTHFQQYNQEKVVDLTGCCCRFIPVWLSKMEGVRTIILDQNASGKGLDFEKGFSNNVTVEIKNMSIIPENLTPAQVVGGVDFIDAQCYAQGGELEYDSD